MWGSSVPDTRWEMSLVDIFHSKKLPDTCSQYRISELELTGLTVNIAAFKTLLLHIDFEAYIDHSVLVYIAKAKNEPKTLCIQTT